MRIAVFHNLPLGGARRTLLEQMKGLSKKHTLDLYEFENNNESFMDLSKFADRVYKYDFQLENNYPGFINRLVRDYKNFISLYFVHKKIAADIDKRRYEVVFVHTDKYTESPYILRFLKTPNIYHCHELLRIAYEKVLAFDEDVFIVKKWYENTTRLIRKYIDKTNARSAYIIVTSSIYIKDKVKKIYRKAAVCLHLGVDTKVFKPNNFKRDDYILYIGGRNKLKGYDLVHQLKKLLSKEIKIKELGFLKADTLIKNDTKLAETYSKALITLCPARSEPMGLVQLESMACGTPVVAVNEGGYRESIVDGITGYLLPRDAKVFADKIKYLIGNPKLVDKMGKAGRQHIEKRFTWEGHVRKLEKLLIKVANEKKIYK